MNNISIKAKLLLVTFITIIGFSIVVFFNQHSKNTLSELNHIQFSVEKLEIEILNLRKHEKDFLARRGNMHPEMPMRIFQNCALICCNPPFKTHIEKNVDVNPPL